MEFGLFQQQQMKLVMTKELRQAITILQYSVQDLREHLQEVQLENPLIDLVDERDEDPEAVARYEAEVATTREFTKSADDEQDEESSFIDRISGDKKDLQETLLNQIRFLSLSNRDREIVEYIALMIDENGYLTQSVEQLSKEMNEHNDKVHANLAIVKSLEPAGVGASSLSECLLLQLQRLETRDELAEMIVARHLEDLANKKYERIAKALSVRVIDIQTVADFLQTLNPRPGAMFDSELPTYIVPDVTVQKIGESYKVALNEQHVPKIQLNGNYEHLLKKESGDTAKYLNNRYEQYRWLLQSIQQRQQTLLAVSKAIVERQQSFFDEGADALKPMTLKDIADEVDVHESTVSRATTKKYMQTPLGLYELKYFFTSTVGKDSGNATSSEKVKASIKRLVDEEKKAKPLSDQKIADLLKEEGVYVSRRTVAKYREAMHIPSSSQRKRFS